MRCPFPAMAAAYRAESLQRDLVQDSAELSRLPQIATRTISISITVPHYLSVKCHSSDDSPVSGNISALHKYLDMAVSHLDLAWYDWAFLIRAVIL